MILERIFQDRQVIDFHVNVGNRKAGGFFDGNPDTEEAVRRQFSTEQLTKSNLYKIGIRTHYSHAEMPAENKCKFIPSVPINFVGINPESVEAQLCCLPPSSIIWFQSFRDPYHQKVVDSGYKKAIAAMGDETGVISHTDDFGRLKPEALEILDLAKARKSIIATPHSNPERTLPLILEAAKMGLMVIWVHPDSRLINTPLELQQALVRQFPDNVYVERAAVFLRDGKQEIYSAEKIVADVRRIGIGNIIFTSDLGRYKESDPLMPDEGLEWYMQQLASAGLTSDEAEMGIVVNPNKILKNL